MEEFFTWVRKNILSPPILFLVTLIALVLLGFGVRVFLGDIFRKIQGNPFNGIKSLPPVLPVDPQRVHDDGTVILPGEKDAKGWVQPVVYPVPVPDIFDSPSVVTVKTPEGPLEVELPVGVDREEVKEVVVIQPGVVTVTVTNRDPVATPTLDKLLETYGADL